MVVRMEGNQHRCENVNESIIGRRGYMIGCGAAIALAAAGGVDSVAASHTSVPRPVAPLLEIVAEANWGRWGEDDQLGAINYLGSEEMFRGLTAATKRGKTGIQRFTLQTPITGFAIDALVGEGTFPTTDTGDPQFPGRTPARRDNVADARGDGLPTGGAFSDDEFVTTVATHGTTHYDALGHQWYGDSLYNGFDPETTHMARAFDFGLPGCDDGEVSETVGLGKLDISNPASSGVAGRGVLLDVARHKVDDPPYYLDLGSPITLDDLLETAAAQGITINKRDILLIRTGSIERARDPAAEWHALNDPGLTYSDDLVRWVRDMEIPIIGSDNVGVERFFHTVTEDDLDPDREHLHGDYLIPLHAAFLRDLGVIIHEMVNLRALATQAAADGIYEFLYTAAPEHVEMATGGSVNPVVLKATRT